MLVFATSDAALRSCLLAMIAGALLVGTMPPIASAQQQRTCKDMPAVCDMKLAIQRQDLDSQATTIAAMAVQINEAHAEKEGLVKRLKELEATTADHRAAPSSQPDAAPAASGTAPASQ